jgi:REP element-mobilizing transposase RayT
MKIEKYLDTSYGQCWLRNPRIATLTIDALKKYDGQSYVLHAYTIMPNHVHVLFSLKGDAALSEVIGHWKGNSSFFANKALQRSGTFWQREYFDRTIKTERQFEYTIRYIFMNPVKAGLCAEVFQWPWTGASSEILYLLKRFFG